MEKSLVLVQDGKPWAAVGVAGDVHAAREAMEELVQTVRKATGATLATAPSAKDAAVVLAAGEAARAFGVDPEELTRQGFRIRCDGRRLVIAGGSADALYYGVCAFLEKALGARWLWPGPEGEVVPRQNTLAVPVMDVVERPDYLWRHLGPGGPLWGHAGAAAEDRWEAERRLGTSEATQEAVRRWMRRNRMGGLRIMDGHAWGEIISPERYAQTHPHLFALVGGRRAAGTWNGKHGFQLCTTQPEVVRRVAQYCREYFDRHPEVDGISISPNDGLGFCECPECVAVDPPSDGGAPSLSDRIFTFARAVGDEVAKTHPDKLLLMLVYSRYQDPPRRASVPANVIVQYCTQARRFWHGPSREKALESIRALAAKARHVGIYEYYIEGAWPDLPRLFGPLIADSIRQFHAAGVRYYCPQAGIGFAVNGWNYYLAARMLWDVKQDPEALLEDFCRAGFGAAAKSVRAYFDGRQRHWLQTGGDAPGESAYQKLSALFPPELLAGWQGLLDRAAAEAESEEVKARVAFLRRGLEYTGLALDAIRRTAAVERAGLPVSGKPAGTVARLRAEGKWAGVEPLVRAAAEAWQARDEFLEAHRDDVLVSHMWIRYNDWERGFHPGRFFAAALGETPPAVAPAPAKAPSVDERYNAYLRRRFEGRPGPKLTDGFPASREEWLAFSGDARKRLRAVFDFPEQDCPLNVRVVGRKDYGDTILERVVYYTEPFSAVPAHLYLPKDARKPAPAIIFPSGHGGSKSRFYNQYAGQLYARAGVVCLIPDPPGEEERDERCRLGVRGHRLDFRVDRGLAIRRQEIGKFTYDLVRGVDYLCSRPEVDRERIGSTGHSLGGTLSMYLTAVDERIRLSMPASWTSHFGSMLGELSCCWRPFGLVKEVGDQSELVALGAPHCATRLLEGENDYNAAYHEGRQRTYSDARRAYALFGREDCLELAIEPKGGHRPYFLMPDALAWVCRHFGPLKWTPEEALRLPATRILDWAAKNGVQLEAGYASEANHGGTRAVDLGVRFYTPEELRCLQPGEWERAPYSLASWVEAVEKGLPPAEPVPGDRAAWEARRDILRRQIAGCLNAPEPGPLNPRVERTVQVPGGSGQAVTLGAIGLGAYLLAPTEPVADAETEAVIYLDASRSREAALESAQVAQWLREGRVVLALDAVALKDCAYLLGESATAHNVAWIREAVEYLLARRDLGIRRITCHSAVDDAGLLAAILDERIAALTVAGKQRAERPPKQRYRWEGIVPGLDRIADRATLLALVAPRPLTLLLPEEPTGLAESVYRLYGRRLGNQP